MTSQVFVGIICGISAGLIVVICYLIYHYIKQRRDALRYKKLDDPRLRSRTIIQNEIPNFHIPTTFPVAIQEPHRDGDYYDRVFDESSDELSALGGAPKVKHTIIQAPRSQSPRRGSVQLEQILTQAQNRPSSPFSTGSSNGLSTTSKVKKDRFRKSSSTPLGQLEFSVYYDQGFKVLQVYVVQGMQIFVPGSERFPDTMVRASVTSGGKKLWEDTTRVAQNTTQPKYNEKLDFRGLTANKLKTCLLKFEVVEATRDDPISECVYSLTDLPVNMFVTEVYKLSEVEIHATKKWQSSEDHKLGQLLVSMSYNPIDKKLTVRVDSAKGLPSMSKGTANPYVKVEIWFVGQKMHSRTTKSISKSKSPIFNEIFVFDVTDDMLPQITITFRVKHHGRIRDSNIGKIDLGYNAESEIEYRHWEQVLDKPHLEIDQWHYIRKNTGGAD